MGIRSYLKEKKNRALSKYNLLQERVSSKYQHLQVKAISKFHQWKKPKFEIEDITGQSSNKEGNKSEEEKTTSQIQVPGTEAVATKGDFLNKVNCCFSSTI